MAKPIKHNFYFFKYVLYICLFTPILLRGQYKVSGIITNEESEIMPYVTVFNMETEQGTSSNENGYFETILPNGTYELVFSHLGYKQHRQIVQVNNDRVTINIQLVRQNLQIQEALVGIKKEDPAYTIIRKSIAKANYHALQYQSYRATIYLKGSTLVNKAPRIYRKRIKNEGVIIGTPFTLETVSEIHFEQPNIYNEKVIAIKEKGTIPETSPNIYVNASFYKPYIAGNVSPLAPSAFYYYKYTYSGGFMENDKWINRIEVTPRYKGTQMFTGYIYIIDQLWAIHSLDLRTTFLDIETHVKQQFAPFHNQIWLPIAHQISMQGKPLGVDFSFNYNAIVNYTEIVPNAKLPEIPEIIDEKIEHIPEEYQRIKSIADIENQEKITRKDTRKLIKKLEKEQNTTLLDRDFNFEIDSNAYIQETGFWERNRPIPLTTAEEISYKLEDSLSELKTDTLSTKRAEKKISFSPLRNIRINLNESKTLLISSPLLVTFNSIEGYSFPLDFTYIKHNKNQPHTFKLHGGLRYASAMDRLFYRVSASYIWNKNLISHSFSFFHLNMPQHISPNPGLNKHINSLYSLLLKENYMRLQQINGHQLSWSGSYKSKFEATIQSAYIQRGSLTNNTESSWFRQSRLYQENRAPTLDFNQSTTIPSHALWLHQIQLKYRFNVTYRKYNKLTYALTQNKPLLSLNYNIGNYTRGVNEHFQHLNLSWFQRITFGLKGNLDYKLLAGYFPSGNPLFSDFAHHTGNQTLFTPMQNFGSYTLLPYYDYSTNQAYAQIYTRYTFRKLLFTQIPKLHDMGLKEQLFIHVLATQNTALPTYTEVGIALDRLFYLFRLEFACAFQSNKLSGFAPRIGVASFLRF